jgi:four helix bundle protein
MPGPNTDGCRHLEIYQIAHALGIRIHAMTLRLPHFERIEEGSQVRRSSKSVSCQLVEGYRLRKYRDKFLLYLHQAAASADETREHLDYLFKTGSLKDAAEYSFLAEESKKLLSKLLQFILESNTTTPSPSTSVRRPPTRANHRSGEILVTLKFTAKPCTRHSSPSFPRVIANR